MADAAAEVFRPTQADPDYVVGYPPALLGYSRTTLLATLQAGPWSSTSNRATSDRFGALALELHPRRRSMSGRIGRV
jgi:hypothetical protein